MRTTRTTTGGLPCGDPELRRSLRSEFFQDVETATGGDLIRVDLTEVALLALDAGLAALPGDRRPRSEKAHVAAHHQASLLADRLTSGSPTPDGPDTEAAPRLLAADLDLSGPEADLVGPHLVLALAEFLLEACDSCIVRCMDRPDARMDKAFHAEEHPSFL